MPDITVEPKDTAPTLPDAQSPAPEAPAGGADLPDDVLKVPAMQAIMAGQPGAFSAVLETFDSTPEAKNLVKHKDALMEAGFGLYRSLDGSKGAVFNQLFVSPQQIQEADQAGQLESIAPPFDELNAAVASSGAANPVLAEGERPTGFATGSGAAGGAQPALPTAMPAPPSSSVQRTLASKRAANLAPGAPASGPKPGSGRILNSILKPVV